MLSGRRIVFIVQHHLWVVFGLWHCVHRQHQWHGIHDLFDFPSTGDYGVNPHAGLILSGNTLYGTASGGGSSFNGTVFKVNTDGTGFTNLHTFTATSGRVHNGTRDSASPTTRFIISDNTLYGTAGSGGSSDKSTM